MLCAQTVPHFRYWKYEGPCKYLHSITRLARKNFILLYYYSYSIILVLLLYIFIHGKTSDRILFMILFQIYGKMSKIRKNILVMKLPIIGNISPLKEHLILVVSKYTSFIICSSMKMPRLQCSAIFELIMKASKFTGTKVQ